MLNKLKISQKIILVFVILAVIIVGFTLYQISVLTKLGEIQDAGFERSKQMDFVSQHSRLADGTYRIIADAIINRHQDETMKNWAERKKIVAGYFAYFERIADTPAEVSEVASVQMLREVWQQYYDLSAESANSKHDMKSKKQLKRRLRFENT